jgi:hypothetical protein
MPTTSCKMQPQPQVRGARLQKQRRKAGKGAHAEVKQPFGEELWPPQRCGRWGGWQEQQTG